MRAATKLAMLITIALCAKLSAQQAKVIINLTEQTAYLLKDGRVAFVSPIASGKDGWVTPTGPRDLAAEFFARVQIGTPVKVIGSSKNVTHLRRAIPIVQPGNSRYAAAFSNSRAGSRRPTGFNVRGFAVLSAK